MSVPTDYQRVGNVGTTPSDYDTTGFPLYLRFDGTDDSLSTGSIDFSATDKMAVFAGVRKLSDANVAVLAEFGPSVFSTIGTWGLLLPDTTSAGSLGLDVHGSGSSSGIERVSTGTAPASLVSTTVFDLAGTTYATERPVKRVNGANATVLSTAGDADTGGGNFTSRSLYIGRRNNAQFPFIGHLYSLIVRGAATDAATITATETWVNGKTKAF